MTFIDDIVISANKLPEPSRFLAKDQVDNFCSIFEWIATKLSRIWIWDYQTDDGTAELFMEPGS